MASLAVDDWEQFLESNYHQLSRSIRVENLLGILRSKSVLNQDDQEMILNQYRTSFLKAGHLLDIVKTKGRPGFEKFMEAIEYIYPDVYREITGLQPRPNPDNNNGLSLRRGVASTVVLDKMGDLIKEFTDQLSRKHLELTRFEGIVSQLKGDLEKQTEEQKSLEEQFQNLEDTIQALRDEKKELTENLSKERRLREDFEQKYEQLRSRNLSELYNLSRQRQCFSLINRSVTTTVETTTTPSPSSSSSSSSLPVNSSSSSSSNGSRMLSSGGKVAMLKDAYEKGTPTPCQPEAEVEKKTGSDASDRPSDDVRTLEENLCRLQESNDRLQCCLEEFKKEADKCRAKQTDAESLSRETCAENEKLTAEMRKMEDQCKLMADMIRRLKCEIDSRRPQKNRRLIIPRLFPGVDEDETQPSSNTATPIQAAAAMAPPRPFASRSKEVDLKRSGSDPPRPAAQTTNILFKSSFDLLVDPWKSFDGDPSTSPRSYRTLKNELPTMRMFPGVDEVDSQPRSDRPTAPLKNAIQKHSETIQEAAMAPPRPFTSRPKEVDLKWSRSDPPALSGSDNEQHPLQVVLRSAP